MSRTDDLRRGMVIRHEGQLFMVLDHKTVQTGKQKPTVHIKLRSVRSGQTTERTLDQLGKIEEVPAELRPMQYLYVAGNQRVFMDAESFEQYELGNDMVGDSMPFLVEQETYKFLMVKGQVVSLQLPEAVVMEVTDTAPVEHAGGSSSVYKEAKLASGLVVHVPLFIKNGDRIRISTSSRQYLGKEH